MSQKQAEYNAASDNVIRFRAQVYKAQTLVDMGLRVTMDLPETDSEAFFKLVQVYQRGGILEVAALPIVQE